jgi:hypothetical protein
MTGVPRVEKLDRRSLLMGATATIAAGAALGPKASRAQPEALKLVDSRVGGSRVGRVNAADDDASRPDLRRPSLPR